MTFELSRSENLEYPLFILLRSSSSEQQRQILFVASIDFKETTRSPALADVRAGDAGVRMEWRRNGTRWRGLVENQMCCKDGKYTE